jgi:hypothetical protein
VRHSRYFGHPTSELRLFAVVSYVQPRLAKLSDRSIVRSPTVVREMGGRWWGDEGVHVLLDVGLIECQVVEADFINGPLEVFPPNAIAADAQGAAGARDTARDRFARRLSAVDIEAQGCAVIGSSQMAPGVEG